MVVNEGRKVAPIRPELRNYVDRITSLQSGGGGGTYDGMEERVERLEADVSDIKKMVADIRVLLASIDERTKHMPTHWQAFGIFLGSLGGLAAIVALTAHFLP